MKTPLPLSLPTDPEASEENLQLPTPQPNDDYDDDDDGDGDDVKGDRPRGWGTQYRRSYGDVPPTWIAKSVSWYMNDPL